MCGHSPDLGFSVIRPYLSGGRTGVAAGQKVRVLAHRRSFFRLRESFDMEHLSIEESLKYLVETISILRADITDIKSQIQFKTYTLKEIAVWYGYKNVQSLLNKPWMMPSFGKPDIGQHPRRWFYNTIVEWYAVSEKERRFKWESMPSRERREVLGEIPANKSASNNRETDFHIIDDKRSTA